jgi:hypothetical protein
MSLDQFKTVERDGYTIHVDKHGFPVDNCGRCGGSGHYSYCPRFGTTCFECGGSGASHSKGNPVKIYSEWRRIQQAETHRAGYELVVGDVVRPAIKYHDGHTDPYRTVTAVEPTTDWCSKSKVGHDAEIVKFYQVLTFDDGETKRAGSELWYRKADTRKAEFAERALAAHVAKLRRRRTVRA